MAEPLDPNTEFDATQAELQKESPAFLKPKFIGPNMAKAKMDGLTNEDDLTVPKGLENSPIKHVPHEMLEEMAKNPPNVPIPTSPLYVKPGPTSDLQRPDEHSRSPNGRIMRNNNRKYQ